jgi:hypothetical protein
MSYFVTCRGAPSLRGLTLEGACAQACRLIAEGKSAVAIRDTRGREIRGDELSACCRGEKFLTFSLRAQAKTG